MAISAEQEASPHPPFSAQRTRQTYRKVAPFYEIWARLTESRAAAEILRLARVREGERVLEVAVGTGMLFAALARANSTGLTAGLDLSRAMLDRARAKPFPESTPANLLVADAYHLPFPTAAFDVLVNAFMIDLLPAGDFPAVVREFGRVLRPGGRIVVATMGTGTTLAHRFWAWIAGRFPALLTGCRPVEILPYLEEAGFTRCVRKQLLQLSFPSEIIAGEWHV